jgi:predicted dehydrogenase
MEAPVVKKLRFAIIGAGAIARAYEAAFRQTKGAAIVAVCDVRAASAQEYAALVGAAAYSSVPALLAGTEFDAAVVCTPPVSHEAITCELLHNGKHVLCEKPLAITAPAAQRMLAAAERSGTVLTMASKFRYAADVRRAREILLAGEIGELVFAENAFTSFVDMRRRWNSDAAVSGGGVLIDNGTHAVDILRYLLGNLRDIQVVEGRRMQGLAVEDTVRLFVHNDEGVMGAADLSWSIDKELETFLRIYGSAGTILVGWRESRFRRHRQAEWRVFGAGYDKIQAFRDQIDNFCGAIRGTASLVVTPQDGLASVQAVQAAYAALQCARWERIGSQLEELELASLRTPERLAAS